jgi:hypothetical protein
VPAAAQCDHRGRAIKIRGGECLGVPDAGEPGHAIPPEITVLTGITAMVIPPCIESVLAVLGEFSAAR